MTNDNSTYAFEPATFHSMRQAQELTDVLEENLITLRLGHPGVNPELVALFSELVNNAAEHGMSEQGAHAHVRHIAHRRGHAFDVVVVDSGQGIRASLARNPELLQLDSDAGAIELAVQESTSGTSIPTRGMGLWTTVTEMKKPGRRLSVHSGSGLLIMRGVSETEIRETGERQGTLV